MVRVDVSAVPLGLLRALDLQLGALLGPGLGIARGGGRAAVSQRVARRQLRGKYKYVDVKCCAHLVVAVSQQVAGRNVPEVGERHELTFFALVFCTKFLAARDRGDVHDSFHQGQARGFAQMAAELTIRCLHWGRGWGRVSRSSTRDLH